MRLAPPGPNLPDFNVRRFYTIDELMKKGQSRLLINGDLNCPDFAVIVETNFVMGCSCLETDSFPVEGVIVDNFDRSEGQFSRYSGVPYHVG